jgi:hypothetical protein
MSDTVRRIASAVLVVACVAAFGCDSMNKDKKDAEKEQRRAERRRQREADRDPDQVIGRDRDRDRSPAGSDRSLRGLNDIPTTATRVDEGSGPRLTYSPTRDGTLYVYDGDDDKVIFSTRVRQDERFALDPDANKATVDGRAVLGTGLSPRHRYRLYFDRSRAN